jgi:hypothetical protein
LLVSGFWLLVRTTTRNQQLETSNKEGIQQKIRRQRATPGGSAPVSLAALFIAAFRTGAPARPPFGDWKGVGVRYYARASPLVLKLRFFGNHVE